jgi:alanine racemase
VILPHSPLRLKIDADALVSNWRWLSAKGGGAACGAAVKANGYGIGAREAVAHLGNAGCRDFFVATWAEAEALLPVLGDAGLSVLHGVGPDDLEMALTSPARPVLNSPQQVARWRESGQGRPCDVMVDTGMNRLGLTPEQARSGLLDGLRVDTLMSHLACADEPEHPLNERQLFAFRRLGQDIPAVRYSLANSAGICLGEKYAFGLTRPGLALYGGIPVPGDAGQAAGIRPVATIEAQIVQLRDVPEGATIGYGATYSASAPMRIGILNIGYADGYLRALGPAGRVRAEDRSFPVVGRVSMDLIAVDLTQETGRELVRIGRGGVVSSERQEFSPIQFSEGDWLTVDRPLPDLSAASGLSQYELLTTLGARLRRVWPS